MKLVFTNPPVGTKKPNGDIVRPRLMGCYINGKYHKFVFHRLPSVKKWKRQIKQLEQSVVNTNNEIEEIKKNGYVKIGYGKFPDKVDSRLTKLDILNIAHKKEIDNLKRLLVEVKRPDPLLKHANEMIAKGIMEDEFVGE